MNFVMKFSATMLLLCCGISALAWFIFKEPRATKQPDMVALSQRNPQTAIPTLTRGSAFQQSPWL
jgi:hypothetical protein